MLNAFFIALLILFQISVFIHILFITSYISGKLERSFKGFLLTTFTNFIICMIMLVILIKSPGIVQMLRLRPMLELESGLIFIFLVFVKVRITLRIIKRSREPENYDISYFGKKVYRETVVKKSEVAVYLLTMPFTLICGAYFVVNILF